MQENSDLFFLVKKHFDNASEAVLITDADPARYHVIYANTAFEKMTGWSLQEIIDTRANFMQGENTNKKTIERLNNLLKAKTDFTGATLNYRKNGSEYFVEWNIHYFKDSKSGEEYFISIQNDLSPLKRYISHLKENISKFRKDLRQYIVTKDAKYKTEIIAFLTDRGIAGDEVKRRASINNLKELLTTYVQAPLFIDPSKVETSAEDYFNEYSIDSESIYGMRDILDEIDVAINVNKSDDNTELSVLFGDLATSIFSLEGFINVSAALTRLSTSLLEYHDDNNSLGPILESLISDLLQWNQAVFINQSASNVHALDDSIIGSAEQICVIIDSSQNPSNDMELELF
jgi:PAS domain S-box-containing protein